MTVGYGHAIYESRFDLAFEEESVEIYRVRESEENKGQRWLHKHSKQQRHGFVTL